ncbi:MAG: uL15 family ribosomal protein [Candidatus Bathyarchaeia archaeon]
MPHKLRKIRKQRGSRTHGYGTTGQHRKHGQKGGRGKTGGRKHLWTRVVKYEPTRFRKLGFRPRSRLAHPRIVNVGQLDEIVLGMDREEKRKGKVVIDLAKLGYDKLLGRGRVQNPYIVKIASFSGSAKEKVVRAGGEIVS